MDIARFVQMSSRCHAEHYHHTSLTSASTGAYTGRGCSKLEVSERGGDPGRPPVSSVFARLTCHVRGARCGGRPRPAQVLWLGLLDTGRPPARGVLLDPPAAGTWQAGHCGEWAGFLVVGHKGTVGTARRTGGRCPRPRWFECGRPRRDAAGLCTGSSCEEGTVAGLVERKQPVATSQKEDRDEGRAEGRAEERAEGGARGTRRRRTCLL